jgi:hypothetical protein
MPPAALAGDHFVALSAVRRLLVERADSALGRCRYIADLGARKVVHPINVARH